MASQLTVWRWRAQRLAERAGPVGIAAGVLALAALAVWIGPGLAMSAEMQALAQQSQALQLRPASRSSGAPMTTERQLAAFETGFPDARALGASYARLWTLARSHGVALKQAEFKLTDSGQDEFLHCAILLPVAADYAALRAFVVDALGQVPGLALEEMSLRRDDSKTLKLDARLRFVLFVRRSSV